MDVVRAKQVEEIVEGLLADDLLRRLLRRQRALCEDGCELGPARVLVHRHAEGITHSGGVGDHSVLLLHLLLRFHSLFGRLARRAEALDPHAAAVGVGLLHHLLVVVGVARLLEGHLKGAAVLRHHDDVVGHLFAPVNSLPVLIVRDLEDLAATEVLEARIDASRSGERIAVNKVVALGHVANIVHFGARALRVGAIGVLTLDGNRSRRHLLFAF